MLGKLSLAVCSRILSHPRYRQARTVLAYCSLPDEVNTRTLLDRMLEDSKRILLPCVISENEMELREYTGPQDLREGAFHILEPVGTLFPADDYAEIDLGLIPGMAFDRQGHRLGRGKGYYDRFLQQAPSIYKIGVCYGFQLMETIPTESHDILMDEVICG